MGLDQPLWQQFITYVGNVLSGNFGMSVSTGRPVIQDLSRFFPATFEMATLGILIGCAIGKEKIERVVRTIWPFYLAILVALALTTYVPAISMTLPNLLEGTK